MEATFSREQALADPAAVNAAIEAIMGPQSLPDIPDAPSDLVRLPGGLAWSSKVYTTATVRELNGADEEALSRAMKSNNFFHFVDTLLLRGTVSVGNDPVTPDMLSAMLLGDRDELMIAIRVATYGEEFVVDGWACPHCGAQSDLKFSLVNDIERIPLGPFQGEPSLDVTLRKGGIASVRYPTGADQMAAGNPDWTNTERNSELLRRCVKTITDPDGNVTHVQAFPSTVNRLSIPDRRVIITEVFDKQPGPRFSSISFVHDECQKEVTLALSVVDLFRELLIGL